MSGAQAGGGVGVGRWGGGWGCGGLGWVVGTPLGPAPGPTLLSPAAGPLVARSLCPVPGQIPAWRRGLVVE